MLDMDIEATSMFTVYNYFGNISKIKTNFRLRIYKNEGQKRLPTLRPIKLKKTANHLSFRSKSKILLYAMRITSI
jgi:hypothetical protein